MYRQQPPYFVHHGGPGFFAWFFCIVFAILLIGLIVAVLTRFAGPKPLHAGAARPHAEDALHVLRLRYARGEIDRESYLQAGEDLAQGP